jgi:CHAT domain-containing protein
LHDDLEQYAQAEALLQKALLALSQAQPGAPAPNRVELAFLRPLPETVSIASNRAVVLAEAAEDRAALREAEQAYALALAVRDRLRQEVLINDQSKLFHGGRHNDLVPGRVGLVRRLFDEEGKADDLETAFTTVEQGTARVFLEQLGKARAAQIGRVDPALLRREAEFKGQINALDQQITQEQNKPTDKRDPERIGQFFEQRKTLEGELQTLVARMEKESPSYAALKYPKPCTLAEARACLDKNEVALLFVVGSERSFVVVVEARAAAGDKTHGLAIVPLPKEDDLADGVSRLSDRNTFTQATTARAAGEDGYDLLLAPVKERIKGKDLVIVTAGPLCQIPFEALRENGKFLIESHRICYAPSLTALHLIRQWEKGRDKPTAPLWAAGDPTYDAKDDRSQEIAQREGRRDAGFGRLINSGAEVRAIAELLKAPAASVRLGREASEAAVKAASKDGTLAKARFVHFACHGILGFDVGQQPALVLSLVGNDDKLEEDGGRNDGFLRLDEVTRLQMNADLVVLSACRTGQGKLNNGEGVTGLARAFLYAGSRRVLSSLWSVDDAETSRFMLDVYRGLEAKQPTVDAVRAAKLKMIQANQPAVFWAPFIHIGA